MLSQIIFQDNVMEKDLNALQTDFLSVNNNLSLRLGALMACI